MEDDMITIDPIEEIYAVRKRISAHFGHNVYRLAAAIAEQQRKAEAKGRKYVRLPIARVSEPFEYRPAPADQGILCACEQTN